MLFCYFNDDFPYCNQTATKFWEPFEIHLTRVMFNFVHSSNVVLFCLRLCTEVIQALIVVQPLNMRKGPIHAKSGFGLCAVTINIAMGFSFCCVLLALEIHPEIKLSACLLGKCD